ncbi:hypothetical protein CCMSSC00406_0005965 [Pleurotus cornucopiae]|uniref:Uncharacterized protein n=1 Tax=Pleurotus cornucopiae TaxID=5321 RepID=A0ACB7IND8_PLECO|nr:hypothetical protein CCMSSC00406_0005965 [Pleurotus cornucopiae]
MPLFYLSSSYSVHTVAVCTYHELSDRDGYTLRATDISNINNEFAVSAPFAIGPEVSSTSSIAPSTSAPISGSITGSGAVTNTAVVTRGSGSGTVLSVPTVSPTASSPASGASGASGGSGTNTAAQGGATNFNGAPSASAEMKALALGAAVLGLGLGWVAGGY